MQIDSFVHFDHDHCEGRMVGDGTVVSMTQRRVLVEVAWTASNRNYHGERLWMNRKNAQVVDYHLQ